MTLVHTTKDLLPRLIFEPRYGGIGWCRGKKRRSDRQLLTCVYAEEKSVMFYFILCPVFSKSFPDVNELC